MSQTNDIVLRRYERSDLGAIVELDAECFAPPFRFSREAMRRFAEAENAWVMIAEVKGKLAGFCIVHMEPAESVNVGYVVTIDVAEGFRRGGFGERMLTEGEKWVRGSGGAGMMLHVFVKNQSAVRFYERLGYKRVGDQRGFYGPGIDAAMYWKEFAAM
jgi:ribosomal-protein-alanine N-acetyltransferase